MQLCLSINLIGRSLGVGTVSHSRPFSLGYHLDVGDRSNCNPCVKILLVIKIMSIVWVRRGGGDGGCGGSSGADSHITRAAGAAAPLPQSNSVFFAASWLSQKD